MAILKNLSLMTINTGVRLTLGVITLSITARYLGIEQFGILMYWMAIAGLLAVISNFGLGTYLLREIGKSPEKTIRTMSESLTAKLILSFLVIIAALVLTNIQNTNEKLIFLIMLMSIVIEGYTEFFCIGFRARNRFDIDTKVVIIGAIINTSVVSMTALLSPTVLSVVIAYLISRTIVTLFAYIILSRELGLLTLCDLNTGWKNIKLNFSYAVDAVMGALFGQVDSIVIGYFLGTSAVGLYQAGMRLFMSAAQSGVILQNVFLPKVAAGFSKGKETYIEQSNFLILAYFATGCLVCLMFFIAGPWVVEFIYGPSYESLKTLMPWFGFLFMLRFIAGAYGALLTAQGMQFYRSQVALLQWIIVGIFAVILVPIYDTIGWIMALLIGTLSLGVLYYVRIRYLSTYWKDLTILLILTMTAIIVFKDFEF